MVRIFWAAASGSKIVYWTADRFAPVPESESITPGNSKTSRGAFLRTAIHTFRESVSNRSASCDRIENVLNARPLHLIRADGDPADLSVGSNDESCRPCDVES